MCSWVTALAQSWACRDMTSAIWNSRESLAFEVIPVVQTPARTAEESIGSLEDGIAINSPLINGLTTPRSENGKSSPGWRNTDSAARMSATNCATGSSRVSVTGANRFRSFGGNGKHEPI